MIKNLLFDLGGVIMDIKRERCVAAFQRLGMADANSFLGEYCQKGPFLKLEAGEISPEEFRHEVRLLINGEVSDEEIDTAFCEFLTGIPTHRLASLRELRHSYGIYLLSNTNIIMWESRIAQEFRHEGLEMKDYFDGITTSFEALSIKPDSKIFQYAIDTCHLNPAETVFLDDSKANLEAAAKLGFKTIHIAPGEEFAEKIANEINRL